MKRCFSSLLTGTAKGRKTGSNEEKEEEEEEEEERIV